MIDQTGHSSKLIQIRDRNNALINPSQNVVEICQVAERVFRSYNVYFPNIKNKMINEIKRNIYQRTIFQELNEHCSGQQLFNTHRDQVIALIIIKLLNLRFHHAASKKEKKKCGSMRKKYTKLILFRNE